MTDTNPYASPAATLAQPQDTLAGTFVPNGKQVEAGHGIEWIKVGFRQLFALPGMWYLGLLCLYGALFLACIIPFVGILVSLFAMVGNPVIMAGIYAAGESQARTGKFEVGIMFEGFRKRTGQLLGVGALVLCATLVIGIVGMGLAGGFGLFKVIMASGGGTPNFSPDFIQKMAIAYLVVLLLFVPVAMASWFAPPLVLFNDLGPVEAMKQSFNASLKNFLPFFLWGLATFGVMIVAMIPVGLGLFVVMPAMIASMYPIYADIFLEQSRGKAVVAATPAVVAPRVQS